MKNRNGMRYFLSRQQWAIHKTAMITFIIICFSMSFPGMVLIPAAFASELTMGEEATLIYSKEDLQNTLKNIKGKLMADFPATTELIFLEDIRNELKRQLAEVEIKIEEDLADMPDVPGEEFNVDFDDMLDDAKRMIYMLDNIIVSPSVEEIDSALEMIETLEQEVQGDLLAARMEIPDKRTIPASNMTPLTYIGTEVTDADLAETDEIVFTDRVVAKAKELHNSFVHMVSWVTLNIKNEFYHGSMKTADEVLVDGAGNAYAQCTLLIALFRTIDTPAKYVRGYKELTAEQFMNWTGTSNIEAAIAVIEDNNNPAVECFYNEAGEIDRVKVAHVYVAFYGPNKKWAIVDPASKEYVNIAGSGLTIDQATIDALVAAIDLNEEKTICSIDYTAIENALEEQATAYDNTVSHVDEVIGKREILATKKIIPPTYLVKGMLTDENYIEEFSAIPSSLQAKFGIELTMPWWFWEITVLSHVTPIAKLAGKRVSIYYEPINPDTYNAAVEEYGSIYNVPNSRSFLMRPVLQIGGIVVAKGDAGVPRNLGYYHNSYTGFWMPGTSWTYQNKALRAGNKYDLSIPTQETSMEELKRLAEELQTVIAGSGLSPGDTITDDMVLKSLHMAGMLYFGAKGAFSEQVARRLNVVTTNHMSLGYICDEIAFAPGNMIKKSGVHIDVVRNSVKVISATGNEDDEKRYMEICGWISTGMEHAMINLAFRSPAASTAMIFAEAAKQGVALHKIRPDHLYADLAGVTIVNPATRSHIIKYVGTYGYIAVIPQRPISIAGTGGTAWRGEGWQVINPVTKGAGYMICGGVVSYGGQVEEVVLINGGGSASIIDHPLSQIELFLLTAVIGLGPICTGLGHMVAADALYATLLTYGGFAFGAPVALALNAVGAALIVAGLVAFVAVYTSFFTAITNSRRRRSYVV